MRRSPKSHRSYSKYQSSINSQLKTIAKNLEEAIGLIEMNTKEAVKEVAEEIKEESLKIAPEDTGELKESAYISEETEDGKYIVEVGYTAEHATFAHENAGRGVDYKNPTTPGTHWQFLLTPVIEIEQGILKKVADKVKPKLK